MQNLLTTDVLAATAVGLAASATAETEPSAAAGPASVETSAAKTAEPPGLAPGFAENSGELGRM